MHGELIECTISVCALTVYSTLQLCVSLYIHCCTFMINTVVPCQFPHSAMLWILYSRLPRTHHNYRMVLKLIEKVVICMCVCMHVCTYVQYVQCMYVCVYHEPQQWFIVGMTKKYSRRGPQSKITGKPTSIFTGTFGQVKLNPTSFQINPKYFQKVATEFKNFLFNRIF